MLHLGKLELGAGRPLVAVSFSDIDARRDVIAAGEAGVAIAEVRADLFARLTPDYVALQAERLAVLPSIGTIRAKSEGGAWTGTDAARIELYEAMAPHVDAIDVELASAAVAEAIAPALRKSGKLLILSHHDFERTPAFEDLEAIARRAAQAGADIVKIAAMVNEDRDIDVLSHLLTSGAAPHMVVIGMGEKGLPTRLAFPAKGSLFTFAAKGDRASAPGQLSYERTLRILSELPAAPASS